MIIDSSSIQLASQRVATERRMTKESLRAWVGPTRPDFEGRDGLLASRLTAPTDSVTISAEARARFAPEAPSGCHEAKEANALESEPDATDADPKLRLIRLLIEKLTGKKISLLSLRDLDGRQQAPDPPAPHQLDQPNRPARAGFGVEYDRHQSYHESESTTFSAQGVIKTADGREIHFHLDLAMNREFAAEQDLSIRLGDAVKKDPLVINFDGTAAQLTDANFTFDLDADGKQDQVSFVGPSSGFLALDTNGDGVINDGGELFGTKTGDGFAELAAYDADHNGWIDGNDAVFDDLLVWSKDAQGNDILTTLGQKGVGALYLGNVGTQFDIKDAQNELLGQVKASGVYVNDNGTVGTIQQLDLALRKASPGE